jgi:hypothetical protein
VLPLSGGILAHAYEQMQQGGRIKRLVRQSVGYICETDAYRRCYNGDGLHPIGETRILGTVGLS